MKQLPNIISCFRIALSVLLLFSIDKPAFFAIIYFSCGISDVLDGYFARLLNAETALGIKLDSLGDFIFYIVWLSILLTFSKNMDNRQIFIYVTIIAIIRITNIVITKIKFKQWNVMHTIGNKLTGLALFLILPICVYTNNVPFWSMIVFNAIATISALEESVILLVSKSYNANKQSVLSLS